jgi:DNA repair protein RAD5
LKPQIEGNAKGSKGTSEALKKQDKINNPKRVKEIVGDGEEVEVEAGEELSKNDINLIYKRYLHSSIHLRPLTIISPIA